jgi:hypothetical protein
MKKLFGALLLLSFLSCKKDKQADLSATGLAGNWKAIQRQNDIGNGNTPFTYIPQEYNYYMNFKTNDNFESNYFLIPTNFNKYKIIDSVKAVLYKQNTTDSARIWYNFENEKLVISFQCIEACRVKLVRN